MRYAYVITINDGFLSNNVHTSFSGACSECETKLQGFKPKTWDTMYDVKSISGGVCYVKVRRMALVK